MQHPRFYLPIDVGQAIGLRSHRTREGRSVEASRRRDRFEYSVICDKLSALRMIVHIDYAATHARDDRFRERCEASASVICAAIAASVGPARFDGSQASDKARGILGL